MAEGGDRYRDTAALTLRADGIDIPPFLIKGELDMASSFLPSLSKVKMEKPPSPVEGVQRGERRQLEV